MCYRLISYQYLGIQPPMAEVMSTPSMLSTSMHFLEKNEMYETEKPYLLMVDFDDHFPKSNFKLQERTDLKIEDIRDRQHEFSSERNGFKIISLESQMTYNDYDDDERRRSVYLGEVAEALKRSLGATRVQVFEHLVSPDPVFAIVRV